MSRTYTNLQDLLDGEDSESPYRFGRSLYKYVDCGPWTRFIVPGSSYGYESPAAQGWGPSRWAAACTGIKIGSIVEGTDAEAGPVELTFPFTDDDLRSAVDNLNAEACAIWDEANAADAEEES